MVSKAYGGRATDSEIMNGTELLPNLEEGDRVLGTIHISNMPKIELCKEILKLY